VTLRPYTPTADGLRLDVRVTPRAGRDAIDGVMALADGRAVAAVKVRALAEDGAANTAVTRVVAAGFAIGTSQVQISRGATSRLKTLSLRGDPNALAAAALRLFGVAILGVSMLAASPAAVPAPAAAQWAQPGRSDICADQTEFMRARVSIERAGLQGPDKSRLQRVVRAAQTMAEDGCPRRDGWLVRRSVGMINAVYRELRRPPIDVPISFRD
jgi:hypothetical protein